MIQEFESVALHHHRQYEMGCAEVLIEEWARSTPARLSMLEKSNDDLPYSIALLQNSLLEESSSVEGNRNLSPRVIGHSRLCRVHNQSNAAFVESVVVSKNLRGRGLGRKLMMETERHAASLGIDILYLTTHDKVDFYRHIGYDLCPPVVSLGSASRLLSGDKFAKLLSKMSVVETEDEKEIDWKGTNDDTNVTGNNSATIQCKSEQNNVSPPATLPPLLAPMPPPLAPLPPPLPSALSKDVAKLGLNSVVTVTPVWMKKSLANN